MNYNTAVTGYPNVTDPQKLAIEYKIYSISQDKQAEIKRAAQFNRKTDFRGIAIATENLKCFIWSLEGMSFICPALRIEWFDKIREQIGELEHEN